MPKQQGASGGGSVKTHGTLSTAEISNDPAYTDGTLWGMYGDETTPANPYGSQAGEAWAEGFVGSTSVAVGILDTGVDYTHPDLYLNIWLNAGEIPDTFKAQLSDIDSDGLITFRDLNGTANAAFVTDFNKTGYIDAGDLLADRRWENRVDDDGNGYTDDLIGWDFTNNNNDPYDNDPFGHGTHIAGVIGADGGNEIGVAGINWDVQMVPLRVASGPHIRLPDAIEAINYFTAAGQASTEVRFVATNNSWGGIPVGANPDPKSYEQALFDAIDRGADAGILFVAAAGNSGGDNDTVLNTPTNLDTSLNGGLDAVISVAALNAEGTLAWFSERGNTTVDLAAPGVNIYSTLPDATYGYNTGTSMATPFVTGAIALYAAAYPEATAEEIREAVLSSVTQSASFTDKVATDGRLDIGRLMGVSPPEGTPTLNAVYGMPGSETIQGSEGPDVISGIPQSGTFMGEGTIDVLWGNGGDDIFLLGDERGIFYDDGDHRRPGTSDYALIMDFENGSFESGDKIQIWDPGQTQYWLEETTLEGVVGTGIYLDTNSKHGSGSFRPSYGNPSPDPDIRDELIGFVVGVTNLGRDDLIYI